MNTILVTGAAGFIGYHLSCKLIEMGYNVVGMDNYTDFLYETELKRHRASLLGQIVEEGDLKDKQFVNHVISKHKPDVIVHLAAYAGVRHSFDRASDYIDNNVVGTQNLIDACEANDIQRVIYASTSCVMAGNPLPWKEDSPTFHQLNPYGYTKRTNECQFMVSKITRTIGLRFFTVYGPWGRPDMGLFLFSKAALSGEAVNIFNYGDMKRDFTYVDDIVSGINVVVNHIESSDDVFNEIYNIGNGRQVNLMDFVSEIEKNFGRTINKKYVPKHPADTQETWSDTNKLRQLGWTPTTSVEEGVEKFVKWYKDYYKVN